MKKIAVYILIIAVACMSFVLPIQAHGLIYETKQLDDNKIRITLKWSNSKEAKGIVISYFYIKNGKTLNIGYELDEKASTTAYIDFDLSGAITPIRVVLHKVGDLKWAPFKDIKGVEAEEYIRHLHDAGKIDAGKDQKFRPKDNITRGEFAAIIVKALNLGGTASNTKGLKDIEKSADKKYILLAVKHGIMSGDKDKKFKPDNPMSLADVSTIVAKYFKFKTNRNGVYKKLKQGKSYSGSVKKMFDTGILSVNDSIYKTFNEEGKINRANCAMMISRALSTY
ncbi:MAG: S-layer homology domain-containing protein [Clostridia bacterium]|nr:S-layer homology domain-containing protein [Clostridia bacterium]